MTADELNCKMHYWGMERAARRVLVEEKLATPEEVALMTSVGVCERLLQAYEVVSCESETITIVKQKDMVTYNAITRCLER